METPALQYRRINSLLHRGIVKQRKVQTIVLTLSAHLGISDRNLKSAEVLKTMGTQPQDRPTSTHWRLTWSYILCTGAVMHLKMDSGYPSAVWSCPAEKYWSALSVRTFCLTRIMVKDNLAHREKVAKQNAMCGSYREMRRKGPEFLLQKLLKHVLNSSAT